MGRMTEQHGESGQIPTNLSINLPPEHAEGHYADFAHVWHNQETFILDFVAMVSPPQVESGPQGGQVANIQGQVVTRVRIPAEQVWEVMKALQAQLGAWEAENPHRKPPETLP
jgi:hypothetical protein